jgi:hypothetical protein
MLILPPRNITNGVEIARCDYPTGPRLSLMPFTGSCLLFYFTARSCPAFRRPRKWTRSSRAAWVHLDRTPLGLGRLTMSWSILFTAFRRKCGLRYARRYIFRDFSSMQPSAAWPNYDRPIIRQSARHTENIPGRNHVTCIGSARFPGAVASPRSRTGRVHRYNSGINPLQLLYLKLVPQALASRASSYPVGHPREST